MQNDCADVTIYNLLVYVCRAEEEGSNIRNYHVYSVYKIRTRYSFPFSLIVSSASHSTSSTLFLSFSHLILPTSISLCFSYCSHQLNNMIHGKFVYGFIHSYTKRKSTEINCVYLMPFYSLCQKWKSTPIDTSKASVCVCIQVDSSLQERKEWWILSKSSTKYNFFFNQFFFFFLEGKAYQAVAKAEKLKMNIILSTEGNKLNEIVQCIEGKYSVSFVLCDKTRIMFLIRSLALFSCVCEFGSIRFRKFRANNDDGTGGVAGNRKYAFTVEHFCASPFASRWVIALCVCECCVHASATLRRISCKVIKINLDKQTILQAPYSTSNMNAGACVRTASCAMHAQKRKGKNRKNRNTHILKPLQPFKLQ